MARAARIPFNAIVPFTIKAAAATKPKNIEISRVNIIVMLPSRYA